MYCRSCNRRIEGNPKNCPYCGARLHYSDNKRGERVTHMSRVNCLILGILYIVLIVMTIIVMVYNLNESKQDLTSIICMGVYTAFWIACLVFSVQGIKNFDFLMNKFRFTGEDVVIVGWLVGVISAGISLVPFWALTVIKFFTGPHIVITAFVIVFWVLGLLTLVFGGAMSIMAWIKSMWFTKGDTTTRR